MRFRKLRIAWSVAWGIACVLLIVLWVRSYSWIDDLGLLLNNSRSLFLIQSTDEGSLTLAWQDAGPDTFSAEYYSRLFNTRLRETPQTVGFPLNAGGFDSAFDSSDWFVTLPCWFLAIALGTLVGLPWISLTRLRFSLRTLLIATTLVAVVLGLIAYLTARPPASPPLDVGDFPNRVN